MFSEKISIGLDEHGHVSGILAGPDHPSQAGRSGVIIAHGAGNDMNHPLLASVAEGLAAAGYATLRFNFPYAENGRKSTDSQAKLIQTWQHAYDCMAGNQHFSIESIIAAGKSMGGRVASQAIADGRMDAAGLIFLGYPLHAPGKKDQLRDDHLYRIDQPMLFFAGSKDPLCDLEQLKRVTDNLSCPCEVEVVEGGNHSFRLAKSANRPEADVHSQVLKKCVSWLGRFEE